VLAQARTFDSGRLTKLFPLSRVADIALLLVRITLRGRSTGTQLMVDELDVARIRAYAARSALMPEARYTGREEPTVTTIEVVRLTLANGAEGIASCDSGWGRVEGGDVVRDIRDISTRVLGPARAPGKRFHSLIARCGTRMHRALADRSGACWVGTRNASKRMPARRPT